MSNDNNDGHFDDLLHVLRISKLFTDFSNLSI